MTALQGQASTSEARKDPRLSPWEAFLNHSARQKITADVKFIFIEKERDRAEHLRQLVIPLAERLPAGSDAQIVCGAFDETVARELDALVDANETLAPCFAMVDPFGVRDTPMAVLRRILAHARK